ncbi:MAG: hypothetical protein ACI4GA_02595 [Acutalibacteraceae bacterium]
MKKSLAVIVAFSLFISCFMLGCGKSDGRVKVNISASSLSKAQLDDLDAYAEENGFDSAEYNKRKGVVSVVIDEDDYDILLYKVGVAVISNVYGLMNSDSDYPYITNIERNKDFSEMKIDVRKTDYEKDENSRNMIDFVGQSCLVYQGYTDTKLKDQHCTVIVRDKDTKEVLYKETFNQED